MKKIINKPETVVLEMCNGIIMAHPELDFIEKYKIIKKRNINKQKVSLISGGGSGHEPAHAGFIGKGMLDAAVCGDVFASPSQIQVYQAIKATESDKGTLLIIKNYSGDMMNFKNAAYLAEEDGVNIDYVRVEDDIAVEDSLYTVGRRGVAGTVLVHKVAGAAAERGLSLEEVKTVAQKTANNVRSLGFAFTSCTVPAKGTPTFILTDDEMEFGVGIHGEPGIKREKVSTADELANRIVDSILKDLEIIEDAQNEIAVLINGFGATPLQELYLLNNSVAKVLSEKNIKISANFVGNYMTSIDMAGASISILKLDDELKGFLVDKCDTPAFKVNSYVKPIEYKKVKLPSELEDNISFKVETNNESAIIKNEILTTENIIYIIDKMAEVIIENEVPFCDLDSYAGDGDFGMSVAKGFKQLKREWKEIVGIDNITIGRFLQECSIIIMEHCGGASGPIWGSAFRGAARSVGEVREISKKDFANMLQASVKSIQLTGERSFGRGAVVGDKTLIDALIPCANSWSENADKLSIEENFEVAAMDTVAGAQATCNIVARMGRAGTVGERSIGHPDAGAYALGIIFTAIFESLKY